jgi:hypothetical protein
VSPESEWTKVVNRFKFHRAPRGRAPPHKTSRIGVHSETRPVSRCLWRERAAPTQDHIKAVWPHEHPRPAVWIGFYGLSSVSPTAAALRASRSASRRVNVHSRSASRRSAHHDTLLLPPSPSAMSAMMSARDRRLRRFRRGRRTACIRRLRLRRRRRGHAATVSSLRLCSLRVILFEDVSPPN